MYQIGDIILIESGPYAGITGTIVANGANHLAVNAMVLGSPETILVTRGQVGVDSNDPRREYRESINKAIDQHSWSRLCTWWLSRLDTSDRLLSALWIEFCAFRNSLEQDLAVLQNQTMADFERAFPDELAIRIGPNALAALWAGQKHNWLVPQTHEYMAADPTQIQAAIARWHLAELTWEQTQARLQNIA
jgi:hypothetical protein